MTPWPGAYCLFGPKRLRIYRTSFLKKPCQSPPGTVLPGFPDELRIATGDGTLLIHEVQSPSGKRMAIRDFLHGHPLSPGDRLD
jgi:methionyl-tRNA formyltransferase